MTRLVLETVLHTILFPGTVLVVLPALLLSAGPARHVSGSPPLRLLGGVVGCGGLLLGGWCTRHFVVLGHGTPNPLDPPRFLVRAGPYQVVRNPMYVAVFLILAGEALVFGSVILVAYLALVALGFHLVVVVYEEPTLRGVFGASYEEYCRRVPRWLPAVGRAGR
jgi:protein-S-isoprenylcysteine O-methyltransferase Ste14